MTPRVVITGTGRCGTGWIAAVLGGVGVDAGHEAYWNPGAAGREVAIDASWCALALGVPDDVLVCHQLRHPLAVISSECKQPTSGAYRKLQQSVMRRWPTDPVRYAMEVVLEYLRLADVSAHRSWRIEDVTADLVIELAAMVGVAVSADVASTVLRDTTALTNWHGAGPDYAWVDLPRGSARDELMDHARRWGWR